MFELINSAGIMLAQTASEKKLTILYLLMFMLFLMLLLIDARTKKKYTGPKIVKNIILFLIFCVGIVLLVIYFRG